MANAKELWTRQLPTEVGFWARVARGDYPEYQKNLIERAAGTLAFPPHLSRFVRKDGKTTRILDVGAGPHTIIGPVGSPGPISITAIDPLAEEYAALLKERNITPLVETVFGEAEKIDASLTDFDLAYSRNALDHSYNPVAAFQAMAKAIHPTEGWIYVEGSVNEGEAQHYSGLHQWNFTPLENDLRIWNQNTTVNLSMVLGDRYTIDTRSSSDRWYQIAICHA